MWLWLGRCAGSPVALTTWAACNGVPEYGRRVLGGRLAVGGPVAGADRSEAIEKGWEIASLEVVRGHLSLFVKHDLKASASYVASQFEGFASRVLGGSSRT